MRQPTFDDPPDDPIVEEPTAFEALAADPATVKARKKASAFAASFNALMDRAGIDGICKEINIDANEVRRVYLVCIEMAMRAEIKAEKQNVPPSKERRFHCPDYVAELFYRRETLPPNLPPEERQRRINSLSRQWRRRWQKFIHPVQCRNHLAFIERNPGKIVNQKKQASTYVERLADLLAQTAIRAGVLRGRPVPRFNRAADEALAEFRKTTEHIYAPDWTPEVESEANEGQEDSTEEKTERDPWKAVRRHFRRCVKDALKTVSEQGLSEDEALSKRLEIQQLIETEWTSALDPDDTTGGGTCPLTSASPCVFKSGHDRKSDCKPGSPGCRSRCPAGRFR